VSLTLDNVGLDEASLGLTTAEQFDLLRLARSTRRNLFFEMFMAILMIPLFKLSGWTFFYVSFCFALKKLNFFCFFEALLLRVQWQLVIPALGVVAARWYLKRLIHVSVGLQAATTFLWAAIPLFPFHTEASRFGALLLLAIFLVLKLYLVYLFVGLFWRMRYVSACDLEVLAGLHLRGTLNVR
jgi:hypothetical protein